MMAAQAKTSDDSGIDVINGCYLPFIHRLVEISEQTGRDVFELCSVRMPYLSHQQIKQALSDLIERQYIEQLDDRRYCMKPGVIVDDRSLSNLEPKTYYRGLLLLAEKSISECKPVYRELGSLTLGLDNAGVEAVNACLAKYREFIRSAHSPDRGDRFYQCNLQFYPFTKHELEQNRFHQSAIDYKPELINSILFELIKFPGFRAQAAWINERLFLPLTEDMIHESLRRLTEAGLITRSDRDGSWCQRHATISTGAVSSGQAAIAFHKAILAFTADVITLVPNDRSFLHWENIVIDSHMAVRLKDKIQTLQAEVLEIAEKCATPSQIYQLSFQFFPVSAIS